MDVFAEDGPGIVIVAEQRRSGQPDFDGPGIRFVQIGQETAFGIVAAVYFIQKIDPLDIELVIVAAHHIPVFPELLDIHHRDFRFSGGIVQGRGGLQVVHKFVARVDFVHHEPAAAEFFRRLNEQVQPVHNEIELRHDAPVAEIMRQEFHIVIGQGCFAAALGMPDDAFAHAGIQFLFNGPGGEKLRIAHHMLLQPFV